MASTVDSKRNGPVHTSRLVLKRNGSVREQAEASKCDQIAPRFGLRFQVVDASTFLLGPGGGVGWSGEDNDVRGPQRWQQRSHAPASAPALVTKKRHEKAEHLVNSQTTWRSG